MDISLSVSPVRDAAGVIVGASKIARDISERKRAQEQQTLVLNEMKHRIKNTLATVQAIAKQTLRSVPDEVRAAFIARLHALASAHDLLTLQRWNGASLGDVVAGALAPFREKHHERFRIEGPDDVWLDAGKSLLLAMALHELATNAVKYGALANQSGEVRLGWERTRDGKCDRLRLFWRESGGPPVRPPEQKGFGSFLVERALQGELGEAHLDFAPQGLACTLTIAL